MTTLGSMSFLDHLSPADCERLAAEALPLRLAAGEWLVERGSPAVDVFQVGTGRFEEVDARPTPEVIVRVLAPGAVLGESAIVDASAWNHGVRAVEDGDLIRWPHEVLHRLFEADPSLGARFFRAVSASMIQRQRGAGPGGLPAREVAMSSLANQLTAAAEEEARTIAAPPRLAWSTAEELAPDSGERAAALANAERGVGELASAMNAWLSNISSIGVAQRAGTVLRTELRAPLSKSRTGQLALEAREVPGSQSRLLAHLLLNNPAGTDDVGMRIDAGLLALASAAGLRARTAAAVDAIAAGLPSDRPLRGAMLHPTCGALLARLLPALTANGADLTVIDGEPSVLAFVDAGLQARPAEVRLSMVRADLTGLTPLEVGADLDVVIVDGLVDYLPSRQLGAVLGAIRDGLSPTGRLIVTAMAPSDDARLMEHLLGWPMLRRTPREWLSVLTAAGFASESVSVPGDAGHCGLVLVAVRSDGVQD